MRRSSAGGSSASGLSATEASRAWENSRPIAAPICATALAGPRRSSRAISEACRLAGTASAREGTVAAVRRAAPSPSASSTRLRHLLDEQRNAVGALDDLRRSHPPAAPCSRLRARDYGGCLTLRKPVERQSSSHATGPATARLNSGRNVTVSRTGEFSNRSTAPTEHFQARRVDPMRVLQDHQDRLLASQPREVATPARPAFFACVVPGSAPNTG